MLKVILASKSPRRSQILKEFGYKFSVVTVQTSELFDKNLSLNNALCEISKTKVQVYLDYVDQGAIINSLIIGCDTMVCNKGQVLGKPSDESEAKKYLSELSNSTHEVKTAVSLFNTNTKEWLNFVKTSKVKMKTLSEKQILDYIATGEPMDKAGAYAIQGLGGKFVESHEGSWYNIVGFPIEEFQEQLKDKGWELELVEK